MANFALTRLAISSMCPLSLTWAVKEKSREFCVLLNFAIVFDFLEFAYFTFECLLRNGVLFATNPYY